MVYPTSEHLALLFCCGPPVCQPPAERTAVLSIPSGLQVYSGSPAHDNRPTHVSYSSWDTKQASAQQRSPPEVAHWAPVRSSSSVWS